MTNEDRMRQEVNNRVHIHSVLQKESTQVQIALEWVETEKTIRANEKLEDLNKVKQNPIIRDIVNLNKIRMQKHKKLVEDLKHYEAKAFYYEMMYKGLKKDDELKEILKNFLVKKGL